MRTRDRVLLVALAVALPAATAVAGRKGDLRLLQRILRVDGPGSGLDADTIQGLTPAQMGDPTALAAVRQRLDDLEARVDGMTGGLPFTRAQLYAHASRELESVGTERLVRTACDSPQDVALSCSGGAYDGSTAFPITWMGVILGDGSSTPDSCMVVVGAGATTPNLEATIRCVHMP